MSRKILLFLTPDKFQAQVWKNGALDAPRHFADNAEGAEQFAEFLSLHRDPCYLLVDLIEEDFRQETIPHLKGSDQQALLKRKFDQYYRSTPFRMAQLQQRQAEGRRDDDMLFSALTNSSHISTWLNLLLENKTPLVGLYSLPHASAPLIKGIESNHLLLLSWEKDAGLRQTYFLNNKLRFSRLTPLPPSSSFADAAAIETARTYQYLQNLSLTPPGEMLAVNILCHSTDKPALEERLDGNQFMSYNYTDLQELAKQFKSKNDFNDSDATELFLHILATQTPRSSYATEAQTHFHLLWKTQRGLFGLAAATAIICAVWGTLSYIDADGISEEANLLTMQVNRMHMETQNITQQFPTSIKDAQGNNVTASDMKSVVNMFGTLQQYSVPPQQILGELTRTLDEFPQIMTGKVSWQTIADGNLPAQEISFSGELLDFGSNYRGALDYLERFQAALTATGYTVTPVKLPLDFSSKGSIGADTNLAGEKPYEFDLKVIRKSQP